MQRSNPNPRLQADSSFSLVGSADVPEPSLDVRTTENRTLKLFTKLMTKYSTLGFFFFFLVVKLTCITFDQRAVSTVATIECCYCSTDKDK